MHAQAPEPKATQEGLVYGKAGDQILKMDYYAGAGVGLHPIAILVLGDAGSSEVKVAPLAAAGYDVFPVTCRMAPYPAPMEDVERAIRYVRFHAREWNGDARKVALIGASSGAYVSTIVGLRNASGVMGSDDAVSRESARVQAVVALFGAAGSPTDNGLGSMLEPLLKEKGDEAALARSSENYVDPDAPPLLLMLAASETPAPVVGSTDLQDALKKVGIRCELIRLRNGAQGEAEQQLVEWVNKSLH